MCQTVEVGASVGRVGICQTVEGGASVSFLYHTI